MLSSMKAESQRVGHFIREWRKKARMTQEKLAEQIGLTPGAISQLENGIINYTQPTIENVAAALGCSVADLFRHPEGRSDSKVKGEDEIKALLRRIDNLPEAAIKPVWALIRDYLEDAGALQSGPPHGQLESSNPRHGSTPSQRRPQRSGA